MFPEGRALEFLIAGVVALIVVGPKDLPVLMRKLGQFVGRLRAMAAEFRASFDEMARQSELDELRKEVQAMREAQLADAAQVHQEASASFADIGRTLSDTRTDLAPPTVEPAPPAKPKAPRRAAASPRRSPPGPKA